jgi:hypothetical protein
MCEQPAQRENSHGRGVDDRDKAASFDAAEAARRSTRSLGFMSIRDVLEKRRRILVAGTVGAFLVFLLGVQLSLTLHRRWLAYLGVIVFVAAGYLNTAWAQMPSLS